VEFWKVEQNGRLHCGWDAYTGKRTHVPGAFMAVGTTIPHDLAQWVIDAAAGCSDGFWGLIARGATFKSTGRRRTRPGRSVIAESRDALRAAESIVGAHYGAWLRGDTTPTTALVEVAADQWRSMHEGDRLVFEWPSPRGEFVSAAERQ
jgi:hypothetical protein